MVDDAEDGLISRCNRKTSSHILTSGSILAGNVQKCSGIAVHLNVRTVLYTVEKEEHNNL